MSIEETPEHDLRSVSRPRPGHADLPGALKFQTYDIRNVLERASARETATRVAVGAFCRIFLTYFGIRIASHVISIGSEYIGADYENLPFETIFGLNPESPLRCSDPVAEKKMITKIDEYTKAGDTLGGSVEVIASPIPTGLGSHIQWDQRLDGQIAHALMSIPSVKGVEIGNSLENARNPGSLVHDEIFYKAEANRFYRKTNRAGGIEGGISNGEDIRIRVHIKPIPTLGKPLRSVDIESKEAFEAIVERSDVCVVPAAGVVAEAMLSIIIAKAFLEKFGGDSIAEVEKNYNNFAIQLDRY